MQELIEKIIEKLEEKSNQNWLVLAERNGYKRSIEIVKKEAAEYTEKEILHGMDRRNEETKAVIEEMKSIKGCGWIPCSERLPTTEEYQSGNGRFLVTDGNRTYEAEFDIYESHTFGRSQMSADWFVTDKCVTHWQNEPLPPKPYQPKGE